MRGMGGLEGRLAEGHVWGRLAGEWVRRQLHTAQLICHHERSRWHAVILRLVPLAAEFGVLCRWLLSLAPVQ